MTQAVIDIGSELTSVLVAAIDRGRITPLWERRSPMPPNRIGARGMADFIEREAAAAREMGASAITVLLAPDLKGGHLSRSLSRRLERLDLGPVRALTTTERSKLSFLGAVASNKPNQAMPASGRSTPGVGQVAVVDLGDAFLSIAAGRPDRRPEWIASRPVHARRLIATALRNDPPSLREQIAAAEAVRRHLGNLKPPAVETTLITGTDARLLELVCGDSIDLKTCAQARRAIDGRVSEIVSAQYGVDLPAARRLPGVLAIAEASADLLGQPLRPVHGGHAEGAMLTNLKEFEADGVPGT